ncbi:hypothetical protein FRB90_011791 [Tulasnella sp. 427]|nr:hypothetical protein FRB90_011791 [Tulasnella sp. 427]
MAEGSKNNLPKSMPSIPAKEREERLPLYLQRLVKSDFTQIPSRGTESFYELCLLCEASTEVEDPNLPDFLSTSYLRYKNFTIDIEGYIQAPGFVKNPYQDLPGYVKRATLPPMPWISSLKSTEPSTQDGTNSGSSRSSNRTRTTSLTQVSVASAQSKAPGGTTSRVPDNVRRLNTVEKFDMTDFSTRVVNCEDIMLLL